MLFTDAQNIGVEVAGRVDQLLSDGKFVPYRHRPLQTVYLGKDPPPLLSRGARVLGEEKHAVSRDWSYTVDKITEEGIKNFIEGRWAIGELHGLAYCTEEAGFRSAPSSEAEWVLYIDPVDGSRPMQSGLGLATFSCAIVRNNLREPMDRRYTTPSPTFEDIVGSVLLDFSTGTLYTSEKNPNPPTNNEKIEPRKAFVVEETYGFPPEVMGISMGSIKRAVNTTSAFHSGSSALLGVSRGQFDAQVDMRRLIEQNTQLNTKKTLWPFDIAAAHVLAHNAGCTITDAAGNPLDKRPLWSFVGKEGSWNPEVQISLIAARTEALHRELVQLAEEGMRSLDDYRVKGTLRYIGVL